MANLSAEYARSRIDYDPDTGVLAWKRIEERSRIDKMWNTRFAGNRIEHKNSTGHIQFGLNGRNHLGHRAAWLITYGQCPPLIDHKNGVRDDNRLSNLRPATRTQNAANSVLRSNNSSGYRGVWFKGGKWMARIRHDRHAYYLGTFTSVEEAAAAYDAASLRLNGEFAFLNFEREVA